jgi:hypothetical protein
MPEMAYAAAFVEDVFQDESRLGGRGAFVPLGRRIVASKGLPGASRPSVGWATGVSRGA